MRDAIAWWLEATGGYGVKLVNPGGVERWKRGDGNVSSLDDVVAGVTPREVLAAIAGAVHELELPHPVHVHCNNLGVGGNWRTTLDTLDTMEGRRAHLAHLQFHAYGGKPGGKLRSRAPELAEYLGDHPEFSADVGQVMFGDAMTMTADAPVSERLRDITGGKWVNADTEVETGCGIVPFTYREKNYVHALQWGIGLELFLLSRDPWRLVLSTDHPNGGSFLSYPRLIRLLMDREFRNEQLRKANKKAIQSTVLLDDLDREYSLEEIAIITRAGPARLLGLRDKGHLGVGADADVTLYDDRADREEMFATPRYVIKGGRVVVRDGELVEALAGDLLRVAAAHDPADRGRPAGSLRGALHRAVRQLSRERAVAARARAAGRGGAAGVMRLHGAEVEDTFAEAFAMWGARIVVTADTPGWAEHAARSLTGFATSVIGCKCEAGIERVLDAGETPDGRPGVAALLFAPDEEGLGKRLVERIGMTVLTCPTTACFNGLEAEDEDGRRRQAALLRRRLAGEQGARRQALLADPRDGGRVPGRGALRDRRGRRRREHDHPGRGRGDGAAARRRRRPRAMRAVEGAILPFPGGIARSGSKVGSRYSGQMASTNHELCPTLRAQVDESKVPEGVGSVFEIVIDGLAPEPVREAMRVGLDAAARVGRAADHGRQLRRQPRRAPLPPEGARPVTLTLTLREAPAAPVGAEALRPDRLAGLSRAEIERLELLARQPPRDGRRAVRRLRRG